MKYPVLKQYEDEDARFVVLFHDEGCGMVVESNVEYRPVGDYSTIWDESEFKTFGGAIMLSNEG